MSGGIRVTPLIQPSGAAKICRPTELTGFAALKSASSTTASERLSLRLERSRLTDVAVVDLHACAAEATLIDLPSLVVAVVVASAAAAASTTGL